MRQSNQIASQIHPFNPRIVHKAALSVLCETIQYPIEKVEINFKGVELNNPSISHKFAVENEFCDGSRMYCFNL